MIIDLIISARGACDDCEPAYIKGFGLNSAVTTDKDPAPFGIRNDTYFVSGFVANGTKKAGIDPNAKNQPFMFAVGPTGHAPRSDAFDAPLRMHSLHGTFQLDMTKAQGIKLPALGTKEVGVAFQGRATRDREVGSPAHAAILGFAFVIVLPIGILMLRLLNKVKLHMIVQGIGLLFITVGWVIGLVISKRYQRVSTSLIAFLLHTTRELADTIKTQSMDFKSPHQIIGIIVYILLLAQWATGFFHHRVYLRTQQPTWMIKPHKYGLGGLVLGLGIVNVAVGFRFANAGAYNMFYVPIVVAVIIVMIMSVTLKKFLGSRRAKASVPFGGPVPNYQAPYGSQVQGQAPGYGGPLAPGAPGGAAGSTWGQRSDIELGKMGPPPSYSNEPTKPREML
jgi:hypothetical protein